MGEEGTMIERIQNDFTPAARVGQGYSKEAFAFARQRRLCYDNGENMF